VIDPIGMLVSGAANACRSRSSPIRSTPFRNGAFDAVTGNFVLSHFRRYETALFDMIRVRKPGGWAR
jgi:ubiquinone/menaquinone biosynthesis C-methylase UbiE